MSATHTWRTRSRSKPWPAPSRSMQLSRISPAPSVSTATASSLAPSGLVSRPPDTVHCHQQCVSPLGPSPSVDCTHSWGTAAGSASHTFFGSMLTWVDARGNGGGNKAVALG